MREAEENIKFKMEIDVLVPIPRTALQTLPCLPESETYCKNT